MCASNRLAEQRGMKPPPFSRTMSLSYGRLAAALGIRLAEPPTLIEPRQDGALFRRARLVPPGAV
jgi:hypothetical protein